MKVTALLAHPDDELMCAGTLARLSDVTIATLFVDMKREGEWAQACDILDCNPWRKWSGRESEFVWSTGIVRQLEPLLPATDLWITHRADDANTSHGHIARVAQTLARKNRSSVWEIDQSLPGGIVGTAPNLFVDITAHQNAKDGAVASYESQHGRYPGWVEAIEHRDRLYGWEIGTEAAEGFTVRKAVWL